MKCYGEVEFVIITRKGVCVFSPGHEDKLGKALLSLPRLSDEQNGIIVISTQLVLMCFRYFVNLLPKLMASILHCPLKFLEMLDS